MRPGCWTRSPGAWRYRPRTLFCRGLGPAGFGEVGGAGAVGGGLGPQKAAASRAEISRLTGSTGELGEGVEYRSAQASSGEGPAMLNPEHVSTGWLVLT